MPAHPQNEGEQWAHDLKQRQVLCSQALEGLEMAGICIRGKKIKISVYADRFIVLDSFGPRVIPGGGSSAVTPRSR